MKSTKKSESCICLLCMSNHWLKIDKKKEHPPTCHLGKMYNDMMFFKLVLIKDYKYFHQFLCKIQPLY